MAPAICTRHRVLGALTFSIAVMTMACDSPPADPERRAPIPLSKALAPAPDQSSLHGAQPAGEPIASRSYPVLVEECAGAEPESCVELGHRILSKGEDDSRAAELYRRACDQGSAAGCGELGYLQVLGRGVAREAAKGRSQLERACNDNDARSCGRLSGLLLQDGAEGRARALGLSEQSCERGDALGCYNLGLMHARGDGVPPNTERAADLFRAACKGDMAAACRELGMAYAAGRGVTANPRQAAAYNIRACDLGDAAGCGNAGINYQRGLGIGENPIRAAHFFKRACDLGDARYCELLQRFRGAAELPQAAHRPAP